MSKTYSYILNLKNDNNYVYLLIIISSEHVYLFDIQVKFVIFYDIIFMCNVALNFYNLSVLFTDKPREYGG